MYLTAQTLDDLLHAVFKRLLATTRWVNPTKGESSEITGVLLRLRNPRARLSRTESKGTVFSCLGELLWYLAQSNELKFIEYYLPNYTVNSDDGKTIWGGYGPRLFNSRGVNQVQNVIDLLTNNPESRRAAIQLFDAYDIKDPIHPKKDIPCTCTMQFLIRRGQLQMHTFMRSNDAFIGLPHDVFCFTMLQEIIARSLNVDVGAYSHSVGSLHLYKKNHASAKRYLEEGWQPNVPMPAMPLEDPWKAIETVLRAEDVIRRGRRASALTRGLDPYWQDLIRLLRIFRAGRRNERAEITTLKKEMSVGVYNTYIDKRHRQAGRMSEKQIRLFSD